MYLLDKQCVCPHAYIYAKYVHIHIYDRHALPVAQVQGFQAPFGVDRDPLRYSKL